MKLVGAHDGRDGASFESSSNKVVTIETLALYGEEEFSGTDRAGIDRVALGDFVASRGRASMILGGDIFGDLGESQFHAEWSAAVARSHSNPLAFNT